MTTYTTAQYVSVPAGAVSAIIVCYGGGASGGGSRTHSSTVYAIGGSGGGSGAYVLDVLDVSSLSQIYVSPGAAVAGVSAADGVDGNDSFVGPDDVSANAWVLAEGGKKGILSSNVLPDSVSGGLGGQAANCVGSTSATKTSGGAGEDGYSGEYATSPSGAGGDFDPYFGGDALSGTAYGPGNDGDTYVAGGGGARSYGRVLGSAGGSSGQGFIEITWSYLKTITDIASGTDLVSAILTADHKTVTDIGAAVGAVSSSLALTKTVTDVGTGVESVLVALLKTVQDSGTGTEFVTAELTGLNKTVQDLGQGVDSVTAEFTGLHKILQDTGQGIDSIFDISVSIAPDYEVELQVPIPKYIAKKGYKKQTINEFEDGKIDVVHIADSVYEVELQWGYISEADRSTIFDFYHDPNKANGCQRTFYWTHPIDLTQHIVRFLSPLQTIYEPGLLQKVTSMQLRIIYDV